MGDNNIIRAEINPDSLSLLITAFKLYNISKNYYSIYKNGDVSICKNLIDQYYELINPDYTDMILNFKKKYISNEILVEKNNTPEEKKGVELAYDFIQNFDVEEDDFKIFVIALKIHSLLYKPLDERNARDIELNKELVQKLMKEAKEEKNLEKYKKAKEILSTLSVEKFGGSLRKSSVTLQCFNADVPDSKEAILLFNEYMKPEKIKEYEDCLNNKDIFEYIEYCVKTTADLIAIQPFGDGNKRTFRAVLNLMFKEKNLPPVYIGKKERKAYHDALEKAVCDKNYEDLVTFYYYKICDSIYELDFEPYLKYVKSQKQRGARKRK